MGGRMVSGASEVWGQDAHGRERGACFEVHTFDVIPGERRLERLDGTPELAPLAPGNYFYVRRAQLVDESPRWAADFRPFSTLERAEAHGRKYLAGAFLRFQRA